MDVFKKTLQVLFGIGVISLLLIGTIIVVAQLYALFLLDGKMAINIQKKLGDAACIAATATGVLGFIQGYVFKMEMGD
jgi:hypothetical protein